MPYVITRWADTRFRPLSVRAVATQEELPAESLGALDALEDGGPITLTDGTTIQVEPVESTELLGRLINEIIDAVAGNEDAVLDAYNAFQNGDSLV